MKLGPVAVALAVSAAAACSRAPEGCGLALPVPRSDTSVIVIVNDTMRRDAMGLYGSAARTPAFDAFGRENVVFDRAFAQAPWTKPSVATLFTSLYPSQHGVLSHRGEDGKGVPAAGGEHTDVLSPGLTTIAEALRNGGFRTAAFVGNPWLTRGLGFEQGFEVYDDSFASWEAHGDRLVDAAVRWLESLPPGERFFLYLHFMESHRPYGLLTRADLSAQAAELRADARPLSRVASDTIAKLVWLDEGIPAVQAGAPPNRALLELSYHRGVENFDAVLGRLLGRLRGLSVWPRTAVVVTADHGEATFERGWDNHGYGLYDDEIAIPLAMRLPGVAPAACRCSCAAGLVDLAPTLYDYLGVAPTAPVFGRSLLQPGGEDGGPDGRVIVSEGVMSKPLHRSIRDDAHLLVFEPQRGPDGKSIALFDLKADPGQMRDLLAADGSSSANERPLVRSLLSRGRTAVPPFSAPDRSFVPIDPELERRLRSLGYL